MTEIRNVRWADKDHKTLMAEIDGVDYSMPGEVVETKLRHPAVERKVPAIGDDGEQRVEEESGALLFETKWDDGELNGESKWTSGNIERQMVADEYENKGKPIPEYVPPTVTAEMIQAEADRRIEALITPRDRLRAMTEDVALPANVKTQAKAIRKKADDIAKKSKIPADYTDDKHWS